MIYPHIRGYESAEHLYIKRKIVEILHSMRAIVAEEAIFPERTSVDILAVVDGKMYFFEIYRKGQAWRHHKDIKVLAEKYAKGIFIIYNVDKLPTENELRKEILKGLRK